MTQTWGDIQEHHYRQRKQFRLYTRTMWSHRVVTAIYRHAIQAWKDRNKMGHETSQQKAPEREYLKTKIQTLYKKHQHAPDILPQLYRRSMQELLKSDTRYLWRWIQRMELMDAYKELQDKRRKGQDIRQYLPMQEKPPEVYPMLNFEPEHSYQLKE